MILLDEFKDRYFEKSQQVLWTRTADTLILHNLKNDHYLELKGNSLQLWCLLDGSCTLGVLQSLLDDQKTSQDSTDVQSTWSILWVNEFVAEVAR